MKCQKNITCLIRTGSIQNKHHMPFPKEVHNVITVIGALSINLRTQPSGKIGSQPSRVLVQPPIMRSRRPGKVFLKKKFTLTKSMCYSEISNNGSTMNDHSLSLS